jgi:hypothetical protein
MWSFILMSDNYDTLPNVLVEFPRRSCAAIQIP